MIAVPITGFWVMPLAVLAFALMPFGLEAWALAPMGWGIDAIIWVAKWVAALPGAAIAVPAHFSGGARPLRARRALAQPVARAAGDGSALHAGPSRPC